MITKEQLENEVSISMYSDDIRGLKRENVRVESVVIFRSIVELPVFQRISCREEEVIYTKYALKGEVSIGAAGSYQQIVMELLSTTQVTLEELRTYFRTLSVNTVHSLDSVRQGLMNVADIFTVTISTMDSSKIFKLGHIVDKAFNLTFTADEAYFANNLVTLQRAYKQNYSEVKTKVNYFTNRLERTIDGEYHYIQTITLGLEVADREAEVFSLTLIYKATNKEDSEDMLVALTDSLLGRVRSLQGRTVSLTDYLKKMKHDSLVLVSIGV